MVSIRKSELSSIHPVLFFTCLLFTAASSQDVETVSSDDDSIPDTTTVYVQPSMTTSIQEINSVELQSSASSDDDSIPDTTTVYVQPSMTTSIQEINSAELQSSVDVQPSMTTYVEETNAVYFSSPEMFPSSMTTNGLISPSPTSTMLSSAILSSTAVGLPAPTIKEPNGRRIIQQIVNHYNLGSNAVLKDSKPRFNFNYVINKGSNIHNTRKSIQPLSVRKKQVQPPPPKEFHSSSMLPNDSVGATVPEALSAAELNTPKPVPLYTQLYASFSNRSDDHVGEMYYHHIINHYNVASNATIENHNPEINYNYLINEGHNLSNQYHPYLHKETEDEGRAKQTTNSIGNESVATNAGTTPLSTTGETLSDTTEENTAVTSTQTVRIETQTVTLSISCPETFTPYHDDKCLWMNNIVQLPFESAKLWCSYFDMTLLHYRMWLEIQENGAFDISNKVDFWLDYPLKSLCFHINSLGQVKLTSCEALNFFICVLDLNDNDSKQFYNFLQ